jgi:alpha-amylase/alpha-mannosidase (GH57 family)
MPVIRVVLLWHMHQPYYKDLVTGEYRLPWVRLHALKDYYGMVRLAEEFPGVHQTFNLVPSLVAQIQEYAAGTARDPFLNLASKPAAELSPEERRQALQYLFQANPVNVIGRYPRYRDLWERYHGAGEIPARAERFFQNRDYTDLQVLSQLAWFDEYFLQEPEIAALVRKGHDYTREDQEFVIAEEGKLLQRVLPEYMAAARSGVVELSTSPFYHPILPLVCDTDMGAVSNPGRPLPQARFQHPEDAKEQLRRGVELHERVFGTRPRGVWPSEGSVSEQVLALAHEQGVQWMATDEGVLGRSLEFNFARDSSGKLPEGGAEKLYTIYRYEKDQTRMSLFFRDHTLSDLIGFVYSSMPAKEAAEHLIKNIKESAKPVLVKGQDAAVAVILDGENAWEYYPQSGREFLRRFYSALQKDPELEAVTASEAVARQQEFGRLKALVPGSWINANFNIWIGAPEDNRSWDYLASAHDFFSEHAAHVEADKRELAYEELLIGEGSDWNWWYGPEHHSVNDRDFDELYRKHLANVYQALGAAPPEHLAHPIYAGVARPVYVPQTAYIHPRIEGDLVRYFAWLGAAMYTADRRSGSMHGKQFVLDAVYAGIDERYLYGRMDFADAPPKERCEILVNLEVWPEKAKQAARTLCLEVSCMDGEISAWHLRETATGEVVAGSGQSSGAAELVLRKNFEFKLPLEWLAPQFADTDGASASSSRLRVRFSLWRDRLPIDALPLEGWIELHLLSERELAAFAFAQ